MLNIDIQTVIIMLLLANFMALLLFLLNPSIVHRERMDYYYIAGRIVQFSAWFYIAFRSRFFHELPFGAGGVLLASGFAIEAAAISFINNKFNPWLFRAFAAVPVLALLNLLNPLNLGAGRTTAIESVVLALPFLFTGLVITFSWTASTIIRRFTGIIYLICSGLLFARFLFFINASGDEAGTAVIHVLTFFVFFLALMIGSSGYIFFKKEIVDFDLIKEATRDYLTGILNRRGFEADAARYFSLASRISFPLSMLMIDIDNFSRINRRFGHIVGDGLLREFTSSLREILRNYDLICRYGGEEFVVLLPNTGDEAARGVAERVRSHVSGMKFSAHSGLKCTVSIGISSDVPDGSLTIDTMYDNSESALYRAKKAGRNRVFLMKH